MVLNRSRFYTKAARQWVSDSVYRPLNWGRYWSVRFRVKMERAFREQNKQTRQFDYDTSLLPNTYVAELDQKNEPPPPTENVPLEHTHWTVGYPAWNLLYYTLYTSLHFTEQREPMIIEIGTNWGLSTIVMAQVLKDLQLDTTIHTVDIDEKYLNLAKQNAEEAGVADYITFHHQDSFTYLTNFVNDVGHIDFIFLDGDHSFDAVKKEFGIIYPAVVATTGKVYFDNTTRLGVRRALKFIKRAYGGNLVEFRNCSWQPPGNAVWQP